MDLAAAARGVLFFYCAKRALESGRAIVAIFACAASPAFAQAFLPPALAPLQQVTAPDINELGLLDGSGPNAASWATSVPGWQPITRAGKKDSLRQLGKALYWDMQVGGDGIQACAGCHFHAGADNRKTNQVSPHGPHASNDGAQNLMGGPNAILTLDQYAPAVGPTRGLPVSESAVRATGAGLDALDGTPGVLGSSLPSPDRDVNDIVSSQGVRGGQFSGLSGTRVDTHTIGASDLGFNLAQALPGLTTARRVPARNSPSVLNAVYNLRNFWDGRAETFFNGVNPAGFRDPNARVATYVGGAIVPAKLRIPFSSLASQAVGPIGSDVEMVFAGRQSRELGRKMLGLRPLDGQLVSCDDSLLGGLTSCAVPGTSNRGLTTQYGAMIDDVFDARFTAEVCVDASGQLLTPQPTPPATCADAGGYTLKEYNFALFFGLAVQAYEATLTTPQTIVDLLVGGMATGIVVNRSGRKTKIATVGNAATPGVGIAIDACIAQIAFGNTATQVQAAQDLCTQHYAQWIHPKAVTGSESLVATANRIATETPIGGCTTQAQQTTIDSVPCNPATLPAARIAMLAINRGLGQFFAPTTGCGICHANAELSLATVSALTGFGKAVPPPLPAGQLRKFPPEMLMERMPAGNGQVTVYDTGFYNLGVRSTAEDWAQGDQIGGAPLSFVRLVDAFNGGDPNRFPGAALDPTTIAAIAADRPNLFIPTAPNDLTPRPFSFAVACALILTGKQNNKCVNTLIPGERIHQFGAFKTPQLRNVKFTGPYMHAGAKMNLQQVVDFYQLGGNFRTINFNNLAAALVPFAQTLPDEAAMIEFLETGLTDWRVAHQEDVFDHPEICIPNGHDTTTGQTLLVDIPMVGRAGGDRLQTFEEQLRGINANRANNLQTECGVTGIVLDPPLPPPGA